MALPIPTREQPSPLAEKVIRAFDELNGLHPGFRPAHAKGMLFSAGFVPTREASMLTKAPHAHRESTAVTLRFSNFAGVPNVADNDPLASGPRGLAVRFHLAAHVHTDIVTHAYNGFPARTAEEFVEFLQTLRASGPDSLKPTPFEKFLSTHPKALEFVQTPKPIPSSFVKESYFGVAAYKFTNENGVSKFGRFRILPEGASEYLDEKAASVKTPNFLFEELEQRLGRGPVNLRVLVQIADAGDPVDDSTTCWPEERALVEFGTLTLIKALPKEDVESQRIIFDPIPRIDGIDASADSLLEPRADVYLHSGRRRRAASKQVIG